MEFDQASRGHQGCSTSGKIQGCCRRDVGSCYFSNFSVKFSIKYRDIITFLNKFFAMVNVFNFRSDILWLLCTHISIIYLHFSYDAEFQKCYMEKMRLKVGFPFLKQHHVQILFKGWIHWYSENPPYAHLSNTVTSLLRPLFLATWQKPPYIFS